MKNAFAGFFLGFFFYTCFFIHAATPTKFVTQDTTWSGLINLNENVIVQNGKTLTVSAGTILNMGRGISITTEANGTILMSGSASQPINVAPQVAGTYFHNIHATGTGAVIEMNYVDVEGGQIKVSEGASGFINNCILHDYNLGSNPILFTNNADSIYVDSTQVSHYYEINIVRTPALIENCLFEFTTADGIDFDNSPPGTIIRNTTVCNGRGFNIDGIDFGKVDFTPPGSVARVENCLVYNFSDKGISIGEGALDVVVMGTVIHHTHSGISVKDSSIATIYNNTFYGCSHGIEIYQKNDGLGAGHAVAYNNIFWANVLGSVLLEEDATIDISYSNLQETVSDTSTHNCSLDPMFIDTLSNNFQLAPLSPLKARGVNGEDLGAIYPVGGIPFPAHDLRLGNPQANMSLNGDSVIFIYWTSGNLVNAIDIEYSPDGGMNWQILAVNVPASTGSFQWTIPNIYTSDAYVKLTDHDDTTNFAVNILPFRINPVGTNSALPFFSVRSGFYNSPIDVSIYSPAGTITYYTLDGSDPTDRSMIYSAPIHFGFDSIPAGQPSLNITASDFPVQPYSYIRSSPETIIGPTGNFYRSPNATLMKAGILRSRIYTPGQGLGDIVTSTYFVDPDIQDRFNMPVISLVTDPENLFNYYTGIYIPGATFTGYSFTGNYEIKGAESEKETSFQFFNSDGDEKLSLQTGIRTRGEWIRSYGQKALTVFARSEYDTEKSFKYIFFKGLQKPGSKETLNEFKRIILRNNGNEWAIPGNTMCRDAMIQSLFDHLDLKYQAYAPSVTFINGEYWGIHNIRELNDAWGIQKNYNIHRDSIILIEDNLTGQFKLVSGVAGEEQTFIQFRDFILQNDMSDPVNFETVKYNLDINNFIDYWSATVYSNKKNTDHNQTYWKKRNGQPSSENAEGYDGRWRFITNDFDGGFYEPDFDNLDFMITHMQDSIFKRLLASQEFRDKFIVRHADLLNSSFATQRVLERIDEIAAEIEPEMPRHIGRWRTPDSMNKWYDNIEELRIFARERIAYQRTHLASQFGLGQQHELTVNVDDLSHGNVNVNTLLISPELPGVNSMVYPWKGIYFEGMTVKITAIAKSGYRFVKWKENGSTDLTLSISLNSDQTFTALFEKDFSSLAGELTIFPNPVTDGKILLGDYHKVMMCDVTGKVVVSEQTSREIDVTRLSSGMYFVKDENGKVGKAIVINK